MTLTEQLKNGQLEAGWYYVLLFSNEEYITFIDGNWVVDDRLVGSDIKEVLAPVPSYEEWRRLQSSWVDEMGKAVDLQKALEWSNEQYNTKVPVLESENQQLKELLIESKFGLNVLIVTIDILNQDTKGIEKKELNDISSDLRNLIDEIDNAIGEKNDGN